MITDRNSEGAELLPCPFCGSANTYIETVAPHTHKVARFMPDYEGGAMATCADCCAAHWRDGKDAEAEVIAAWNRRASPSAAEVQALVEADREYDAASEAWDNAPGCVQAAGDTDGRDCDGPEFQRYVAAMDRRNRALDELAKLIPRNPE